MKKTIPWVYIIVLNYNGYEDTCECIRSLKNISYPAYKIVLVDNDSPDQSGERLSGDFPECHFIQTGKNLGYAGGNNAGIKFALEQKAEYICIVNNDVVVEKDFLEPIIAKMETDASIGIAGPTVCEYRSRDMIQSAGAKINLFTAKVPPIHAGKNRASFKKDIFVDYIYGTCCIVRRSLIEKIGLIPEEYFLFFEETEWCLKAKKENYRILCVNGSYVYHKGSMTISKTKGLRDYYLMRNCIVFEKRNASRFQLSVFLVYKTFIYILVFAKGVITGKFNHHLHKGFKDGMRYRIH